MFAEKSFYETRGKELSVKISKLKAIQIKKTKKKKQQEKQHVPLNLTEHHKQDFS